MTIALNINDNAYEVDVDENMPLLWVLRDELGLVGTKYSCGIGVCGACCVLIEGAPVRSCAIRVGDVKNRVTTIEGTREQPTARAVQESWVATQVAQCGYCQPGQIITAIALLEANASVDDEQIERALAGVLCRCGTYSRIRKAVKSAARQLAAQRPNQDSE